MTGVLAAAAGCAATADPAPVSPELGTEFTLAPGETVRLDGDRLVVSFGDVPADSRCPAGADCVWEGDATVVTEVTAGGQRSRSELHTNSRFATGVTVGGYRIDLVSLRPSPPADGAVPAGDYRADLLVTRA
ncbi:hypothetical protein [Nocardia jinanensis]|uniref:Uncharacterized protein n=2 Tax=Nocardia jinanensis TaxID=382504 RepID=A0A917RR80_9NOCA|nr:hypothetical protein [Nocardia jinanensis]GGL19459.1 hypothetical protein GCM10011588_37600 [Nocardia jinanensis]